MILKKQTLQIYIDSLDEIDLTNLISKCVDEIFSNTEVKNFADLGEKVFYSSSYTRTMCRNPNKPSIWTKRDFFYKLLLLFDLVVISQNKQIEVARKENISKEEYSKTTSAIFYDQVTNDFHLKKIIVSILTNDVFVYTENNKYHGAYSRRHKQSDDISVTLYPYSNYDERLSISIFGIMSKDAQELYLGQWFLLKPSIRTSSGLVLIPKNEKRSKHIVKEIIPKLEKTGIFKQPNLFNVKSEEELITLIDSIKSEIDYEAEIKIPEELAIGYQQFMSFFSEYVKVVKGEEIIFNVTREKDSLKFKLKILSEDVSLIQIKDYLHEYLSFAKSNFEKFDLDVKSNVNERDIDILILELKNQISHLERSLEIAKLKNNLISKETAYLKQLTYKLAEKDTIVQNQVIGSQSHFISNQKTNNMKIENQNIYGGNQQFADLIINSNNNLDEVDRSFIELIHENVPTPEERQKLINELSNIKDSGSSEEEKRKSGGVLKKFLDSVVSESGKQIIKEVFEKGGEYLDYIG